MADFGENVLMGVASCHVLISLSTLLLHPPRMLCCCFCLLIDWLAVITSSNMSGGI